MAVVFGHLVRMKNLQYLMPFYALGWVLLVLNFSPWLLLAIAWGCLLQFLFEYILHRFAYHGEPPTDQSAFSKLYRTHIAHHEFPTDPRFFAGDAPWYGVRVAALVAVLHGLAFWPLLGLMNATVIATSATFVGGISAYLFYEYCHTLAHVSVRKGAFGQWITRTHLAHHYQDHHATFHVSAGMGWIDWVWGTAFDKARARERFDAETHGSLGMKRDDPRLVLARKELGLSDPKR
ncbi:MAG: sterol desaturase family protein [Alphaproteobacteria bacterium]